MSKGKLIILVGLARSGKSTYATKWAYEKNIFNNAIELPRVVINSDEVRLAMYGQRFIKLAEPLVHAHTKLMARTLYNMGYACLIDETNTTVGSIKQWLEIDPDAEFVYIDTPVHVCQKRAIDTNQSDLLPVIDRMYKNLQKLQWYSCECWRIDLDHDDYAEFFDVYEKYLQLSWEKIRKEVKQK